MKMCDIFVASKGNCNMPRTKYTEEILRRIVSDSRSFRDATIRLGVKPHGGTIASLKKRIVKLGIDHSHFSHQAWNKGLSIPNKLWKPEELLVAGREVHPYRLRKALKDTGRRYECAICGLTKWLNKPIALQVDHINGKRNDNTPDNLRFICPNCHSQTDNYGFKGRKHG